MGFILCYLYNLISGNFFPNYFPMKTYVYTIKYSQLMHWCIIISPITNKQYCSSDCIKNLLNKYY